MSTKSAPARRIFRALTMVGVGAAGLTLAAQSTAAGDTLAAEMEMYAFGNISVDPAGNAIAVGRETGCGGAPSFRYRHATGTWSSEYPLPLPFDTPVLSAPGRTGMPVVAGFDSDRMQATIRRTDATWSPVVTLSSGLTGTITGMDMAGNPDGDFVVSWTMTPADMPTGRTYAAVRQHGGTWRTFLVGGLSVPGPTAVGIDAYGRVTVARRVLTAGESVHRLLTRTKPVTGPWQSQIQVSPAGTDVDRFDMVIERTGRATLAYAPPPTEATWSDGQPKISTGPATVLRQDQVGAALTEVWSRPAATFPGMSADGGRLRLAWVERDGETVRSVTQAFNPKAGPVAVLGTPANLVVGIDRYGVGVVSSPTALHRVTASSVGPEVTLAGRSVNEVVKAPAIGPAGLAYVVVQGINELPVGHLDVLNAYRSTPDTTATATTASPQRSTRPAC